MHYLISIVLSFMLFCGAEISANYTHQAFEIPQGSTLYENIKDQYLKSFKVESALKTELSTVLLQELQKTNQISLVFDLFARNEQRTQKQTPQTLIMPLSCADNLNLFCGNKTKPKHTLLAQITRTNTLMGLAYFSQLLAQPTDDTKILTNRQEIIYALLDDQALYAQLKLLLQEVAATEPQLLALWQTPEQVGTSVKDAGLYYQSDFYHKYNKRIGSFFDRCNNDKKSLDLMAHSAKLGLAGCIAGVAAQIFAWTTDRNTNWQALKNAHIKDESTSKKCYHFCMHALALAAPIGIPGTLWWATETYIKQEKEVKNAFKNSGERLHALKTIFNAITQMTQIIKINPALVKNLTLYRHLTHLIETESATKKLTKLKELLESANFEHKNSCKPSGTLLLAYKLLDEIKDDLVPAMSAIGELDAYLSAATLYQEHAHKKNRYSFVTFCTQEKPYLKLNQFWNPYLPTKDPVLNDLELGAPDKARNLIISGPNAGGKSTYLKGTILAVLMAQVFGIAPAQGIKMTPFSCLDIYKDIVDDAANQKSLFRAEVFRVKTLIDQARSLRPDQCSLIITDEMFSGTNPLDATDLNRAVAEEVSTIENSIWMISTHFHDVTKVEQDTNGAFKNAQVIVARNEDGSFSHYTFKVKDGSTQDSTALDVLKMENIEPQIIARAEELKKFRTHKNSWHG